MWFSVFHFTHLENTFPLVGYILGIPSTQRSKNMNESTRVKVAFIEYTTKYACGYNTISQIYISLNLDRVE